MKRIMVMVMLLTLTACNTIQGLGQDIKDGGAAMSHAINGNSSSNADKDFSSH